MGGIINSVFDRVRSRQGRRPSRRLRNHRGGFETLEPRTLLAVTGLPTAGNRLAAPLVLATDGLGPNDLSITLDDTLNAGFVTARITANTPGGTVTRDYFNFGNRITFTGTFDIGGDVENEVAIVAPFGMSLVSGGTAFEWNTNADFGAVGLPDIDIALVNADVLSLATPPGSSGVSSITGTFTSPTLAPTAANPGARLSIASDDVIEVLAAGVNTYDLTLDGTRNGAASKIDLQGPVTVSNDLSLVDANDISIDQPLVAGGAITIATAGSVAPAGLIDINAPVRAGGDVAITSAQGVSIDAVVRSTAGGVAVDAGDALQVFDDVLAFAGITLEGETGVTTDAAAELIADTGDVALRSPQGFVAAAGGLAATTGGVNVTATKLSAATTAVTALTGIKLVAGTAATLGGVSKVTGDGDISLAAGSTARIAGTTTIVGDGDLTLDAGTDVSIEGISTVTGNGGITLAANGRIDIRALLTTLGTGGVEAVATTGNVTVFPAAPLVGGGIVTEDGGISLQAVAGRIDVESRLRAEGDDATPGTIEIKAATGIGLTNATDATAELRTVGAGGEVTLATAANAVVVGAPITSQGDGVAIASGLGSVEIRDDVAALTAVTIDAETDITLDGVAPATVTVSAATGTIAATSATARVIAGPNLIITAGPGRDAGVTLTAGTTVQLAVPVTAGGDIGITSPDGFTVARPLVSSLGAIAITAAEGPVISVVAPLTANLAIAIEAKDGVTIDDTLTSTTAGIALTSTGSLVSLAPTAKLVAADVVDGSITIDAAGAFVMGSDLTAGSDIAVTAGASFAPATDFTSAAGDIVISVTAGDLDLTASTVSATAGSITLDAAAGAIDVDVSQLLVNLVTGNLSVSGGGVLTIVPAGAVTVGGSIALASRAGFTPPVGGDLEALNGNITLLFGGPIDVTNIDMEAPKGSMSLTSETGDVTVGAGAFTVEAAATGSITLAAPQGTVTIGQALAAGGAITISALGDFVSVENLAAVTGDVSITTTGAGAGIELQDATKSLTAGGGVTLTADGGPVTVEQVIVAQADVTISSLGTFTSTNTITALGGGIAITTTGAGAGIELQDATKSLTAGGGVTLTADGGPVTVEQEILAQADVTISSLGSFSSTSTIASLAGTIAITSSGGNVDVTAATLAVPAGGIDLAATAGFVFLDPATPLVAFTDIAVSSFATLDVPAPMASTTGGISLESTAGFIEIADTSDLTALGGVVSLIAAEEVNNGVINGGVAAVVQAADLTVVMRGGPTMLLPPVFAFTNELNNVDTLEVVLESAGGVLIGAGIEYVDSDSFTVLDVLTATGTVDLTALNGSLTVNASIGVGVTLSGIVLTALDAVTVTGAGSLAVAGTGDVLVTSQVNDIDIAGPISTADGNVVLTSGGGLNGIAVGGTIAAVGAVTLTAVNSIAVSPAGPPAVLALAGDVVATSSNGGIDLDGDVESVVGDVLLTAENGGIAVVGSIFADGDVAVNAGKAVTLGAAGGGTTIVADSGNVVVESTGTGGIDVAADITALFGGISVVTPDEIRFDGASLTAAKPHVPATLEGLVRLDGLTVDIVGTPPTVFAGRLELTAISAAAISFTGFNQVDTLSAFTAGAFEFHNYADLSISDDDPATPSLQVAAGGDLTIRTFTDGAGGGRFRVIDGLAYGGVLTLSADQSLLGVEFVTTSTGDNAFVPGFAGTVRDMLGYVNANTAVSGGVNSRMAMVFDEPGSAVALDGTVVMQAALPGIAKRVLFDGSLPAAEEGLSVGGIVGLDGSGIATLAANGLTLVAGSSGSLIQDAAIHGFPAIGIQVFTAANVLRGLEVGRDRVGEAAGNGVGIEINGDDADRNVIGVNEVGAVGNVVVDNLEDGIRILDCADSTLVFGNFVGVLPDGTAMGNGRDGIRISDSYSTQIGIAAATPLANDISHNGGAGVFVVDVRAAAHAYGVQIRGNVIGANGTAGVDIQGGSRTSVGGTASDAGNLIAGNAYGVRIGPSLAAATSFAHVVAGNVIDGNLIDGVLVTRGYLNRIRGNEVSGSGQAGIRLFQTVAAARQGTNVVTGNTLTGNGDAATNGGIVVEASSGQLIGMTVTGGLEGNLATGNGGSGIVVVGGAGAPQTRLNVVSGNVASANAFDGIRVQGAISNTIDRNQVADNDGAGVAVVDAIASLYTTGNRVTANAASGNGVGIRVAGGDRNTIGGQVVGLGNRVFSNLTDGIVVESGPTSGPALRTLVRNNWVGLDAGNAAAGNGGFGIRVDAARGTTIDFANLVRNNAAGGVSVVGGDSTFVGTRVATKGNVIAANGGPGVVIGQPAAPLARTEKVTVAGNLIEENGSDGVVVEGDRTRAITVGQAASISRPNGSGNTIRANDGVGIRVDAAQIVTMIGNSIYDNADPEPILIENQVGEKPAPTPISATMRPGNAAAPSWDIRGVVNAPAGHRFYVDIYMDVAGGGQVFMGRVQATGGRAFRTILRGPVGGLGAEGIRATATAANGGLAGSTSEFSVFWG